MHMLEGGCCGVEEVGSPVRMSIGDEGGGPPLWWFFIICVDHLSVCWLLLWCKQVVLNSVTL